MGCTGSRLWNQIDLLSLFAKIRESIIAAFGATDEPHQVAGAKPMNGKKGDYRG
jgi:hypothetical protein